MLLLPQEGKHEKMSKAPQTQRSADKSHQLLLCACHYCSASICVSVCLRVKLVLLFSRGCFGRLAGASDGKLASDWHSHGFSRWPFTQKAFSHSVLNFSQSLLNTLRPLPPSICVCVFLCFVCSLMILQPRNHLLF